MKKTYLLLMTITLLLFQMKLQAQNDYHEFNRTGGSTFESGTDIVKIPAGGYVLVGETKSSSTAKPDILVIRYDACMEVVWAKIIGYSGNDETAPKVIITNDGNYFIAATHKNGAGDNDYFVFQMDDAGTVMWKQIYKEATTCMQGSMNTATNKHEAPRNLIKLNDGRICMVGYKYYSGTGGAGVPYIGTLFINPNTPSTPNIMGKIGNLNTPISDIGWNVVQTAGGTDLIYAGSKRISAAQMNGILTRFDYNTTFISGIATKTYSFSGYANLELRTIHNIGGGQYLVTGNINNGLYSNSDILIMIVNDDLEIVWHQIYSTPGTVGDYVIEGDVIGTDAYFTGRIQQSSSASDNDYLVFKFDLTSNTISWVKTLAQPANNGSLQSIDAYPGNGTHEIAVTGTLDFSTSSNIPIYRISPSAVSCNLNGTTLNNITPNPSFSYTTPILGTTGAAHCSATNSATNSTITYTNNISCPSIISLTGGGQTICPHENATLSVSPGGQAYLWSNGATTNSITVSPNSNTNYTVTVTYVSGCTQSISTWINVYTPPSINILCSNPNIICGDPVTLTAIGCSGCQYSWTPGGATTQSITDYPSVNTTYTVSVIDDNGCIGGAAQDVTVDCPPESFCLYIPKLNDIDNGEAIIKTSDGGTLVVGSIHEISPATDKDIYAVKYDSDMNMIFATKIGDLVTGSIDESGFSVVEISGDYYLTGSVEYSTTENDVFAARLDNTGAVIWAKKYGNGNNSIDVGRKIIEMWSLNNPSTLLITGFTNSSGPTFDILTLKVDMSTGSLIAQNSFATNDGFEFGFDAIQFEGREEFYIAGEHFPANDINNRNMICIRIDENLLLVGATNNIIIDNAHRSEAAFGIEQLYNDIYLAGYATNTSDGSQDIYIVKLDANLGYQDDVILDGSQLNFTTFEIARRIKRTNNAQLIISGIYDDLTPTGTDGLIIRINPVNGLIPVWSKSTAFQAHNESYLDLCEDDLNNIFLTGSYGFMGGDEDIFIAKITGKGESCCMVDYPLSRTKSYNAYEGVTKVQTTLSEKPHALDAPYYDIYWICGESHMRMASFSLTSTPNAINNISIVPNPNNGQCYLKTENASEKIRSVLVYNIYGQLIDSDFTGINSNSGQLSIPHSESGLYLIEIVTDLNKYQPKMIIQK